MEKEKYKKKNGSPPSVPRTFLSYPSPPVEGVPKGAVPLLAGCRGSAPARRRQTVPP